MKKRLLMIMSLVIMTFAVISCGNKKNTVYDEESGSEQENVTPEINTVVPISAEYPVYDTAQQIVNNSSLIFSGTITNITYDTLDSKATSGADPMTGLTESHEIPYTLFEISIDTVYKGSYSEDTIIVKRPGGIVNNVEYILENATTISLDETYLFLTETYENAYPSLLNVTQAVYDMNAPEAYSINETNGNEITLAQILDILE